jgi:hypothetical protein
LNTIKDLAETDAAAAWGVVTVAGVFFAIDLTLLTTVALSDKYAVLAWLVAFTLSFVCLVSALAANAATVVKQTITLRLTRPSADSSTKTISKSPLLPR